MSVVTTFVNGWLSSVRRLADCRIRCLLGDVVACEEPLHRGREPGPCPLALAQERRSQGGQAVVLAGWSGIGGDQIRGDVPVALQPGERRIDRPFGDRGQT